MIYHSSQSIFPPSICYISFIIAKTVMGENNKSFIIITSDTIEINIHRNLLERKTI